MSFVSGFVTVFESLVLLAHRAFLWDPESAESREVFFAVRMRAKQRLMAKRPLRLIVGITGATGPILGVRLLQVLKEHNVETHLIISNWSARTLVHETPYPVTSVQQMATKSYGAQDQAAAVSSGSFITDGVLT